MPRVKVHYADSYMGDESQQFPLCLGPRSFDSPRTRNTRKVTCKLCLALLDSR